MSTFFYNGVMIRPVYTETCQRENVYDGPTYLWTKWTIRIRGLFNPGATSYTAFENAALPVPTPGRNAAWTDNAVRLMLSQPRGGLLYTSAGEDVLGNPLNFKDGVNNNDLTILRVPPPSNQSVLSTVSQNKQFSDANNGPVPLVHNVKHISGTRTFVVDLTVTVCVNECYRVYASPSFVLSNRWEMSNDIDAMHFCTRTVQGRAIFRTDVMLQQNIRPDDYRAAFFFPVPKNFKRQNVRVNINAAGNELRYSFSDVEQSHNILVTNVTKIEATATISMSQDTTEQAATGVIGGAFEGAATGAAVGMFGGPKGAAIGGTVGAAWGGLKALFGPSGRKALPHGTVLINVRVWGNRLATRRKLESVASSFIRAKLPQTGLFDQTLYGIAATNTYDLMGRFVEARMVLHSGPITSLAGAPAAIMHGLAGRFPTLLDDEVPGIATAGDFAGYSMPNDSGTRGTYIEACVAQALQGICQAPASPGFASPVPDGNTLTMPPTVDGSVTLTTSGTSDRSEDAPTGGSTLTAQQPPS